MNRAPGLLCCLVLIFSATVAYGIAPQNIIIFIGDGMGPEQVEAGGMWAYGSAGTLSFESMPYQGYVTTYAADSGVTDSAAAGTAMATGVKVNNGVISKAIPGDGSELETLLEMYQGESKSTGLVTTTYMSHATPAAFGAHESSRNNYSAIANDLLSGSQPNVLMGGAKYVSDSAATAAGYTVATTRDEMLAIDTNTTTMLSGQFGSDHLPYDRDYDYDSTASSTLPRLSAMTSTALDILDNDADGFFLMVEGGRIDHAGHDNSISRLVEEAAEFSNAVQAALDWAAGRSDTLILVTADHETGGLSVLDHSGTAGDLPSVSWSTGGHTGANVPIYAWGPNAELVNGVIDNTDIYTIAASGAGLDPSAIPLLTTNPTDGAVLDFGRARIGASTAQLLTATNTGEPNSGLLGNFPAASGEFGPDTTSVFGTLGSGEDTSREYSYAPTDRGSDTLPVIVTSNGGNSTVTLTGTGVGPVFESDVAPGATLDFDILETGIPSSLWLDISNITTDDNGGLDVLTDLTLLSAQITGPGAGLFDLVDFTPGSLLHQNDLTSLEISYNGTGVPGYKDATLEIFTDVDAALGQSGLSFSYDILATLLDGAPGSDPGYASAYVTEDGSIIFDTSEAIAYYEIFIGDWFQNYVTDLDLLSFDAGLSEPNWTFPFTSKQNRVDGYPDEGFAEVLGLDFIEASDFDTGVNVTALPEDVKLWLQYQKAGGEVHFVEIPTAEVPEPATLTLLGLGLLGLLAGAWRRR